MSIVCTVVMCFILKSEMLYGTRVYGTKNDEYLLVFIDFYSFHFIFIFFKTKQWPRYSWFCSLLVLYWIVSLFSKNTNSIIISIIINYWVICMVRNSCHPHGHYLRSSIFFPLPSPPPIPKCDLIQGFQPWIEIICLKTVSHFLCLVT